MFNIKLATINYMNNVFELSNDDTVRANSINHEKIKWEDHVGWYSGRIKKLVPPFLYNTNKRKRIHSPSSF